MYDYCHTYIPLHIVFLFDKPRATNVFFHTSKPGYQLALRNTLFLFILSKYNRAWNYLRYDLPLSRDI